MTAMITFTQKDTEKFYPVLFISGFTARSCPMPSGHRGSICAPRNKRGFHRPFTQGEGGFSFIHKPDTGPETFICRFHPFFLPFLLFLTHYTTFLFRCQERMTYFTQKMKYFPTCGRIILIIFLFSKSFVFCIRNCTIASRGIMQCHSPAYTPKKSIFVMSSAEA